ncbi:MAG: enoyl-CoA hydratase [Solirubrobacterales bacterium]|jgi:enoyl-CoA hydratase|nr:enoyl-CoA hydratase [Solirubrobacterales bacterium]
MFRRVQRSFDTLRWELDELGVATIALDEPDSRNALSDAVMADLLAAFAAARDDDAVRCVVLASTHPTTFSAGGNLGGFASDVPLAHKHDANGRFPELFTLIGQLGKPVIAAVDGHCLAGAFGLALACDLIVASDAATFGTPEINVGVFPFMIAVLIYRNLPRKKATELMLMGDRIDAHEARELGIVNAVVPREDFARTIVAWSRRLAGKSPLLMKLGRDALWRQHDLAAEDAWDFLRAQLTIAFATDDMQEGVTAFFEKRQPLWSGR